jgi:hypothetical protein
LSARDRISRGKSNVEQRTFTVPSDEERRK